MKEKVIITGVTVKEEMRIAEKILRKKVIPKDKEYQKRLSTGKISRRLRKALKSNA